MTGNDATNKAVIVAFVGASGSGKTYASMYLKRSQRWHSIVSYTTRPMRQGERDGREHYFRDESYKPNETEAMAMTFFGGYWYWTWRAQFIMPIRRGGVMTYVVDEKGLVDLKEKLPDRWRDMCTVVAVKVKRGGDWTVDKSRLSRDSSRTEIPDSEFDYVLENCGSIQDWEDVLDSFAEDVRRKYLNNHD